MGCDIHIFRERKVNGDWETDTKKVQYNYNDDSAVDYNSGVVHVGRNYLLFSILSGVRAYVDLPIAPPAENRGIPEDISDINLDCCNYWGEDAHSHGWLNMAELDKLIKDYEQAPVLYENTPYAEDALHNLVYLKRRVTEADYFKNLPPEDCRIIIFYDN